jgi:hypothetical protein
MSVLRKSSTFEEELRIAVASERMGKTIGEIETCRIAPLSIAKESLDRQVGISLGHVRDVYSKRSYPRRGVPVPLRAVRRSPYWFRHG